MKNNYLLITALAILFSCNTKKTEEATVHHDTIAPANHTDTAAIIKDSHYFWEAELSATGPGLDMIKTRPIPADSLTAPAIIAWLNKETPEIQLTYKKISGDTIFIKIPNSTYLTQQMGTSGADAYMAALIYNLTEVAGINYVDVRFREGDHAAPGTYARTDFVKTHN
ncbi:hypothetical protein [Ferruginibacter sp. SUN106]|uniref:hypothetical protein n=1 Tax=Ferruginibacter sp. SUN106 TaxID=2978348 RepID=UPI003D36570A